MHGALCRANFIDNFNVGDIEEILMIVAALDLDGEARATFSSLTAFRTR